MNKAARQRARVTLADIAREAGVAPSTASNALNGRGRVDATTVERVRAAASRLGYTPNPVARMLRGGRTGTIGLFSPTPFAISGGPARMAFMMEIAASAASAALEAGFMLILAPPLEAAPVPPEAMAIDAALVIEPVENDLIVARLEAVGVAVVVIGGQPGRADLAAVDLGSEAAFELLLRHLSETGARRIALITATARRQAQLSAEAAYAALVARTGQPPLARRVEEADGEDGGRRAALDLLAADPAIDAVLVSIDAFAVGVAGAAAELGRTIPRELRIATRHDGPRARDCPTPLTAVDLGLAEVGREAVAKAVALIEGGAHALGGAGQRAIRLVPRASTVAD